MNIPETIFVLEAIRPDKDNWFPSRVYTSREDALHEASHAEGRPIKSPWVFRVVEFKRVGEVES